MICPESLVWLPLILLWIPSYFLLFDCFFFVVASIGVCTFLSTGALKVRFNAYRAFPNGEGKNPI